MKYTKQLPPVRHLQNLANCTQFPASRSEIVRAADYLGFSDMVKGFLDLFPANEVFENRQDFTTRCEELEILIAEERTLPEEFLRSPQD